jgi:hypothetical protein
MTTAAPAPWSARKSTNNAVTAACLFHEDDRGGFVWHFHHGNTHLMRSTPSLLRKGSGAGRWRASLHLPFEVSVVLREIRHEAALHEKARKLVDIPVHERPGKGRYRVYRREAMRRYFAPIHTDILDGIADWNAGSYPLLRFLLTTPDALDLMHSEDGARLAWCLANLHEIDHTAGSHPLRTGRSWVRRRRRDILGRLGLPPTNAALQALRKVPRASFNQGRLGDLGRVLRSPILDARARHLPVWDRALDVLHEDLHPFVHDALLRELCEPDPVGPLPTSAFLQSPLTCDLRHTLELFQQARMSPPVFRSVAHLREVHDDMMARRTRLEGVWSKAPFPPFPVELSAKERRSLTPLIDSAALLQEGRTMHHCLGTLRTHHLRARRGHFHAFAMTRPERLSLAFIWNIEEARWSLYDLRGPANQHAGAPAHDTASHLVARLQQAGPPPPLVNHDGVEINADVDEDVDADVGADDANYDDLPWEHLVLDPFDYGHEDGPF